MADIQRLTDVFNDKFAEFLSDVIHVLPNDQEIKTFKTSFNMMRITSDTTPRTMFHKFVSPYYQEIMDRNEMFFKQKHIYQNAVSGQDHSVTDELIDKLSDCWDTLSPADQKAIWDYLNLLVRVCKKIYETA